MNRRRVVIGATSFAAVLLAAVLRYRSVTPDVQPLLSATASVDSCRHDEISALVPCVVRLSDESTPQVVMLAVRNAFELRDSKRPMQADRYRCACRATFHWPDATGAWVRVPIALDSHGPQYVQLRYPAGPNAMIVPQVRIDQLPIVSAGELR